MLNGSIIAFDVRRRRERERKKGKKEGKGKGNFDPLAKMEKCKICEKKTIAKLVSSDYSNYPTTVVVVVVVATTDFVILDVDVFASFFYHFCSAKFLFFTPPTIWTN